MKEEIEEMPIENCLEEYCCKWEQRNREIAGKRESREYSLFTIPK